MKTLLSLVVLLGLLPLEASAWRGGRSVVAVHASPVVVQRTVVRRGFFARRAAARSVVVAAPVVSSVVVQPVPVVVAAPVVSSVFVPQPVAVAAPAAAVSPSCAQAQSLQTIDDCLGRLQCIQDCLR